MNMIYNKNWKVVTPVTLQLTRASKDVDFLGFQRIREWQSRQPGDRLNIKMSS